MDGVVDFDFAGWVTRFPAFGSVSQPLAAQYFADAGLFLNNSPGSPVADLTARGRILNLIAAHIATLAARDAAMGAGGGLVGRISSASEGSVSVSATIDAQQGTAAWWWLQTTYGALAWQAMAPYRTMRYRPGHQRNMSPWIGGYPRG